jgi:putative ABC transport system permease protein
MTPQQYIDTYGPTDSLLTPLDKIKLHANLLGLETGFQNDDDSVYFSVLIVILSAINFINLKTAQASQRAKEIGVRKAIGSTNQIWFFNF